MMMTDIFHAAGLRARLQANSGLICMILAMLLLPVGDTFAKLLTGAMDPLAVTMWRLLAQGLFLVPVALVMRKRLKGAMLSPAVMLSGALLAVSLTSLIHAFSVMPIATAIAIFFVEPLILTVLAGPLLKEYAGPRRLIAVGVGLVGAMIVIRPGYSVYGWATLLPLLSACAYALNMIVLKRASGTRSALTMQCGATLTASSIVVVAAGLMSVLGGVDLAPLVSDGWAWGAILASGGMAALSFLLIAEAFRRDDATALAPFQYFEIISATVLGLVVFKTFPDSLTVLGIAIILGSGLYVFHREGQSDKSAPRRRRSVR